MTRIPVQRNLFDIPKGFCQCGCGQKTIINPRNQINVGWIKGEPRHFLKGHHNRGKLKRENHPRWKGGISIGINGNYVRNYRHDAEKALGKPLPSKAHVHHHNIHQIVICNDAAYHHLLHQRTRAFIACGHANWRKCKYCKIFDNPNNLLINNNQCYHKNCYNLYMRTRKHGKD